MSFAVVGGFLVTYGSTIAAGTAVVSAAVGTYAAYESAQTQKKVATHNAQLSEIAAQDAERRGDKAADEARHRGDQLAGAERAAFAARGLDISEGTPANILDQASFFSLADQTAARNNAGREAWARRAGEQNFQWEADSISPNAVAFSTFLTGAGSVASRWYKPTGSSASAFDLSGTTRGTGD